MSYSPTSLPAVQSVTVGTSAVDVNIPAGFVPQLGALILQRSGDANNVYRGWASGVTTGTGALVAKGSPGTTGPTLIPKEAFQGTRTFWLIGGAASQTVDVEII